MLAAERNARAAAATATTQAAQDAKDEVEAAKRRKVGEVIARQGNAAFLKVAVNFLRPYALALGPLKQEDGSLGGTCQG